MNYKLLNNKGIIDKLFYSGIFLISPIKKTDTDIVVEDKPALITLSNVVHGTDELFHRNNSTGVDEISSKFVFRFFYVYHRVL